MLDNCLHTLHMTQMDYTNFTSIRRVLRLWNPKATRSQCRCFGDLEKADNFPDKRRKTQTVLGIEP